MVVVSITTRHPHPPVLVAASAWLTRQRAGVHRALGVPGRPKAPQRYRCHTWASRSQVPALVRLPPSPAGPSVRGAVWVPACSGFLTSQDVLQAGASWTWMLREKGSPGRSSSWRGSWTLAARASAWTSRSPASTRIRMQVSAHASQSERPVSRSASHRWVFSLLGSVTMLPHQPLPLGATGCPGRGALLCFSGVRRLLASACRPPPGLNSQP